MTQKLFLHTGAEHWEVSDTLSTSVEGLLGEYKSHRVGTRSFKDFNEFVQAKYDLIGFVDATPCDVDTWDKMGEAQDPFVKSLMRYIRKGLFDEPEAVDINEETIYSLSLLAVDATAVLPRKAIDRSADPALLIRKFQVNNSLILAIAKVLDREVSLTHEHDSRDYMELGASYDALVTAAKICRRLSSSYPVESIAIDLSKKI